MTLHIVSVRLDHILVQGFKFRARAREKCYFPRGRKKTERNSNFRGGGEGGRAAEPELARL